MLRDRKQQFQASLSRAWRVGLVATLIAAGLGIAGLRGPGEGGSSLAQAAPPADAKKSQDNTSKKFSLDYIPANANFVLAFRPAELVLNEAIKPLVPMINEMLNPKAQYGIPKFQYGIALAQLEEIYFVWFIAPPAEMEVVTILRSIEPLDAKSYKCPTISKPTLKTVGGRSLYTDGHPMQERAYFFADGHTVVLGSFELLAQLPGPDAGDKTRPRWAEQWKSVAGNPVALALDVEAIRGDVEREISLAPGASPWIKLASPLWEQTDAVVAGVTVGDKLALHATAVCVSAEGAGESTRDQQGADHTGAEHVRFNAG